MTPTRSRRRTRHPERHRPRLRRFARDGVAGAARQSAGACRHAARVEAELKRQGYVYNRGAANLRRRTSVERGAGHQRPVQPVLRRVRRRRRRGARRRRLRHPARQHRRIARAPAGGAGLADRTPPGRHHPVAGRRQRWRRGCVRVVGIARRCWCSTANCRGAATGTSSASTIARGARLATEHLLALGPSPHRLLRRTRAIPVPAANAAKAIATRCAAAGIAPEPHWLIECAPTRLEAAAHRPTLCSCAIRAPTAAVCYNDAVALGLMLGPASARAPRRATISPSPASTTSPKPRSSRRR